MRSPYALADLMCRAAWPARHLLASLVVSIGLLTPALAQKPPNVTPGEMALLPNYCPDTQGFDYGDAYWNTSPRAAYWVSLMGGKSFWALHHHCWALVKIRRAEAIGVPPEIRKGTLQNALSDFDYVLQHSTPDFVLRPEVLLRRAEVLLRLGDVGAVMLSYEAAVQFKPDYWPAYVGWAEYLLKQNRRKDALAFLERGLVQSPNEPKLSAAYRKAGGDPEAFVRKLPPRKPQPAASAGAATASAAAAEPAGAASAALAASDGR